MRKSGVNPHPYLRPRLDGLWRVTVGGVLTLCFLGSLPGQEKQQEEKGQKAQLPDGPGKQTFVQICGSCHAPEVVLGKGFTEDGWTQVVGTMIERGAQGSDDQFTAIVQYLKTNFPPIAAKVNVNNASADILVKRLGITTDEAQAIIAYRELNGNFKSVDELKNVPKLDFSKIEAKKDMLVFN